MKIKFDCRNHFNAYWGVSMSVLRARRADQNWTCRPTWRHYSIGIVSPATHQNGQWYFWPLRFGILHKARQFHVYLGLVFMHVDTNAAGSLKDSIYQQVGPFSFIWQT